MDTQRSSSILSGFDLEAENDPPSRSAPQVNWFSRFLRIKPANKVLCFQIGRGKVRQEIVRLLRDWQHFGVKDVTFDRPTNSINARVDKNNRKYTRLLFSAWSLEGHARFDLHLDQLCQSFSRNVVPSRIEPFKLTTSCLQI